MIASNCDSSQFSTLVHRLAHEQQLELLSRIVYIVQLIFKYQNLIVRHVEKLLNFAILENQWHQ